MHVLFQSTEDGARLKLLALDMLPVSSATAYYRWFTLNFPAENSPYLGVSHHPEMIGTGVAYIPCRDGALKPVLPTFTGTIFIPW